MEWFLTRVKRHFPSSVATENVYRCCSQVKCQENRINIDSGGICKCLLLFPSVPYGSLSDSPMTSTAPGPEYIHGERFQVTAALYQVSLALPSCMKSGLAVYSGRISWRQFRGFTATGGRAEYYDFCKVFHNGLMFKTSMPSKGTEKTCEKAMDLL